MIFKLCILVCNAENGIPKIGMQKCILLRSNFILPNNFGPVTIDSHGHNGARLACRQGQLSKFRLLHTDLIIAMQSAPPEVFAPVGVLVIDHQQSEASVFAVWRASGRARYRRSQNRSTLRIILTVIHYDILALKHSNWPNGRLITVKHFMNDTKNAFKNLKVLNFNVIARYREKYFAMLLIQSGSLTVLALSIVAIVIKWWSYYFSLKV